MKKYSVVVTYFPTTSDFEKVGIVFTHDRSIEAVLKRAWNIALAYLVEQKQADAGIQSIEVVDEDLS